MMMEPRAFLVGSGSSGDKRWPLASDVVTIGRGPENDIIVDDREVSRRHAQLRHDAGRFLLVDLGSKNGTRVNGVPVASTFVLSDGDELRIGTRARFLFRDLDATVPGSGGRGRLVLDSNGREVTINSVPLHPPLAPQQFRLLALLMSRPGRVFTRAEIAEEIYPEAPAGVTGEAVDGVVRRLRARLDAAGAGIDVTAVRGHGFKLESAGVELRTEPAGG
jgi:pSer/pThr/pTyr-binding forkhead associated (FHA) protein